MAPVEAAVRLAALPGASHPRVDHERPVGDRLFVNKLRFGPHIPFTSHSLPGYATPGRGNVVVLVSPPQDESIRIAPDEVTPTLVKRIVGVGGDTLLMRHGQLYVNGTVSPSPNAFVLPDSIADRPEPIFTWQHRIEIRSSRFGSPIAAPSVHEWGPLGAGAFADAGHVVALDREQAVHGGGA